MYIQTIYTINIYKLNRDCNLSSVFLLPWVPGSATHVPAQRGCLQHSSKGGVQHLLLRSNAPVSWVLSK